MIVFFRKRLDGSFVPACEDSERLARKFAVDELAMLDWHYRNTRSVRWHKRYFALCQLIFQNCEGIEVNGQWIEFSSVEAVHLTLKGLAGLYDAMIALEDGGKAFLIRSIAFSKMTGDEWAAAWPRILDVVHQTILPSVDIIEIENEIAKVAA